MFTADQYQLLDFGQGRRLERFGDYILDRPCPAAENIPRADPGAWAAADARFEDLDADQGLWHVRSELPERWCISHGNLQFELKRTPQGQGGLFPEQAENWEWLLKNAECGVGSGECSSYSSSLIPHPSSLKILNL